MSDDDLTILGRRVGYGAHPSGPFGISRAERRRHLYVQGKTGTGKSTLLANMLIQDIARGEGVCLIDPLGTTAEEVIDHIPSWRTDDFRYFNVADPERPLGLNTLSGGTPDAITATISAFAALWGLSREHTPQLLSILGYA